MTQANIVPHHYDDWDAHWSGLNEVTELNPAQHYRHRLLKDLVASQLASNPKVQTILDLGSGQGDLLHLLTPVLGGRRAIGLELSRTGVEISSKKTPTASFFQVDLVQNEPARAEVYGAGDLCICSEVVEHLDEPAAFLANARRYMAPGATFIVTVPGGPMNAFEKSIGHRQHFKPDTISALLSSAGFKIAHVQRAGFPFFNLYKIAAKLRGDKVREDAARAEGAGPSGLLKLVLLAFDALFHFNLPDTPFGWQIVVIAKNPD